MKAIILSAGQGTRLLPYTTRRPKCLVNVQGEQTLLDLQLRALASAGIEEATVVTGFQARQVTAHLWRHPVTGLCVETIHNPFFDTADNLVSCWQARAEMRSDFLVLNGDTLFSPRVLQRLLAAPPAPITLAVDTKDAYDEDDMKVDLAPDGRICAVSKTLNPARSNGESIGLMSFRGEGPQLFHDALADLVWRPSASRAYYLSVIDQLAQTGCVHSLSIADLWWAEVDTPEDLLAVRSMLGHGPIPEDSKRPVPTPFGPRELRRIH
jgi:choline kinase